MKTGDYVLVISENRIGVVDGFDCGEPVVWFADGKATSYLTSELRVLDPFGVLKALKKRYK